MKARKKGSNEEWKDVIYVQLEGSDILYKDEYIEFQHDNLSTELKTYDQADMEKHWQDVRERAAIAAMQSIISSDELRLAKLDAAINTGSSPHKEIAVTAVNFADALVKQLKGDG